MDEKETGGLVLLIIFVIAMAIIISRRLFPFFLALTIISFVGLIAVVLVELFNDSFGEISLYVAGAFVIFLLLTSITWFIGYGIGGTSFGEASLEIYYTITGAEQQVTQELQNAINLVVDESCKTLTEENCNLLKATAKSAKTLQEVSAKVNQLKSLNNVIESVS